jgi:hypothetical protein
MSKKIIALIGLAALTFMLWAGPASAQEKPIQLSLFSPLQLVPESQSITALRLNLIYGNNTSVSGLDLGLVNHTTAGTSKGLCWGLVNINEGDFVGAQISPGVNYNKGRAEGFQWGFVNYAGHASGFQLGLVNYAMSMRGLQIGLVNFIKQGGQFPVFPIVNWSF